MLSAAQQERYARHLLLDGLGGRGQEKLLAGAAFVDLPEALGRAGGWAARYLAASGVGTVILRGPWAEACARECRALWPEVSVRVWATAGPELPPGAVVVEAGAQLAATELRGGARIALAALPPDASCADEAALGALAALEALKALAATGAPRTQPLRAFDADAAPGGR